MAGTILEFNELAVGQQFGLQTTDRGIISAVAIPNPGSPGALGFTDIEVSDADHVFNGNGSGGAIQIFPLTILRCRTIAAATRTWTFETAGVSSCFFVGLNIEGASPGEVEINDQDDVLMTAISVLFPTGENNSCGGPTLYFDTTAGVWRLLRNRILIP